MIRFGVCFKILGKELVFMYVREARPSMFRILIPGPERSYALNLLLAHQGGGRPPHISVMSYAWSLAGRQFLIRTRTDAKGYD